MTRPPEGSRPLGDDGLVRRAARGVAWQVAALVALAILLLVGIVTLVVVRGQQSSADALLRSAVATADDVGDPPSGCWLVLTGLDGPAPGGTSGGGAGTVGSGAGTVGGAAGGATVSTAGLPAELGAALGRLRDRAPAVAAVTNLEGHDSRHFRVATQRRTDRVVQVVLDLTPQRQERARLVSAVAAAAALGLLFAGSLGLLLGRRAVRPLAQALALQRTFVADAGHELRTPLTLLSTRAQLLDRAVQASALRPAVRADSSGVVHDVQRLGEVVEDLLLAADPSAQERHEPVDLGDLVAAVVDSARAHAEVLKVALVADTAGPAGPEDPQRVVPNDAQLQVLGAAPALRRAVLSLVDNAIDHTPAGGTVTVRTRRTRRQVVVSVSDTGPGITPEQARVVMRRFHSGGQRAGRAHYGLGLALTHDVANRHGGQLRLLDAAEGGGSGATFELVLPVCAASD